MPHPEPCKICGSPVRLRPKRLEGSLADPQGGDMIELRICTNPRCDSNTGNASMADVV